MGSSKSKGIPKQTANAQNDVIRRSLSTRDHTSTDISSIHNRLTTTSTHPAPRNLNSANNRSIYTYPSFYIRTESASTENPRTSYTSIDTPNISTTATRTENASTECPRITYPSFSASSTPTTAIRPSTNASIQNNSTRRSFNGSSSTEAIGRPIVPPRRSNSGIVRDSVNYRSLNATSSSTSAVGRSTTLPTINQLEEEDINLAIRLSLIDHNNANRTSAVSSSSLLPSAPLQHRTNNTAKANPANSSNTATSKGEMTFDCSICMEFNENDVIVATECGHVFHKNCVSPWISGAGTCPTCRVRVTISSLRKIFVSVNANTNASTSNVTHTQNNNHNIRNKNNNNNRNNEKNRRRTNPNTSTILPTMFSRTIWLSSQDKQMNEQSLATFITQRFNLSSNKFSIKSLKKAGSTQQPLQYVSFKISVDTESTFNTLNNNARWPNTYRVREFIERNRRN